MTKKKKKITVNCAFVFNCPETDCKNWATNLHSSMVWWKNPTDPHKYEQKRLLKLLDLWLRCCWTEFPAGLTQEHKALSELWQPSGGVGKNSNILTLSLNLAKMCIKILFVLMSCVASFPIRFSQHMNRNGSKNIGGAQLFQFITKMENRVSSFFTGYAVNQSRNSERLWSRERVSSFRLNWCSCPPSTAMCLTLSVHSLAPRPLWVSAKA